jgi:hypothetical protein
MVIKEMKRMMKRKKYCNPTSEQLMGFRVHKDRRSLLPGKTQTKRNKSSIKKLREREREKKTHERHLLEFFCKKVVNFSLSLSHA